MDCTNIGISLTNKSTAPAEAVPDEGMSSGEAGNSLFFFFFFLLLLVLELKRQISSYENPMKFTNIIGVIS